MRVAVKDMDIAYEHGAASVVVTFGCASAYEAALFYEDLIAAAKTGRVAMNFKGEVVEEENGGGNG